MQITFFNFGKKTNSTKLVNVQGVSFNHCELKGGTSMVSPVLLIKDVPAALNPIWNYCRIPAFSRYYFISDWRWINGVWECSCAVDVLATYKTQIGETSQYILRSSFSYDGDILDTAYITTTDPRYDLVHVPSFFESDLSDGFYVVGIIGTYITASQGAITYYQMTAAQLASLRQYLMSNNFLQNAGLSNLTDFVPADAIKVIYNPFQYIASCQWFPFPMSAIPSTKKTLSHFIDFGWWSAPNIDAYTIHADLEAYTRTGSMVVSKHPQSVTRGDYLNKNPYTTCILRYPPFSEIEIPMQYFRSGSNDEIQFELSVDFITGLAYFNIYVFDPDTAGGVRIMHLGRMSTKVSVDIQLAQVSADYLAQHTQTVINRANFESNALGSMLGGISLDPVMSIKNAITGYEQASLSKEAYLASDLDSYIRNGAPQLLTGGSNGSLAAFKQQPVLCYTYYMLVDENKDHIGRPLCTIEQISDIPGFIMVQNPDIDIPCMLQERALIVQYMAGGFYYE